MSLSRQVFSYGLIGVLTNGMLYGCYLGLTTLDFAPSLAMTICYVGGIVLSYLLNGRLTFRHGAGFDATLLRFILAYVVGYGFNLAGLRFGVSVMGLPHQGVQFVLILLTAALLFVLQKFWVFSSASAPS
ncbi:MAG: GtrA family protein [Burkholderiales bacterium]|nr:GtrA family protein [Burkholderiales bacterium]